jgi:hypothetical protein
MLEYWHDAADTAADRKNGETTMHAHEMTFGVEIETTMPIGSVTPGGHGCGRQVPWLPAGWLADRDPSIIYDSATQVQCEFVSPVLKGADGLRQLCEVVRKIKAAGGKVNDSCGIHVHVGFDKNDTKAVDRLLALVANHEKAIYAVTGTKNRERGVGSRRGTCWCKSVRRFGSAAAARSSWDGPAADRYHVLNLTSDKPTVEFRPFAGSLNPVKIAGYVRLCVALAQKAVTSKRACRFASRSACWRAGRGEGYAEVTRLFYDLKWWNTEGIVGSIEGEGVPSLKASKQVLRKMAKKYDRQA